jgi:hypothetical protein
MNVPYALRRAMIRNECDGAAWVADRSWHPEKVAGLYAEAMAGNADPACSLFHDLRGHGHEVELLLHVAAESKARRHLAPVLRAALVMVWNHAGMGLLMQELRWSRAALVHLCDLAGAPDVSDLPERVTVYRGGGHDLSDLSERLRAYLGARSPAKNVARGLAWTLDQKVARFFADRQVTIFGSHTIERAGPRCVLAAEVARSAIVLRTDDRDEAEVILRHAPRKYEVLYESFAEGQGETPAV